MKFIRLWPKRSRFGPTGQTIGPVNFTLEIGASEEQRPAVLERVSHAATRTIQNDKSFYYFPGSLTGTRLDLFSSPSTPIDAHNTMRVDRRELRSRLSCFTIIVKTRLILINIQLNEPSPLFIISFHYCLVSTLRGKKLK